MTGTTYTRGGGRFRIPPFGSVALVTLLLGVLWSLVLTPGARADSLPQLTDASTGSTVNATVGDTVKLTPGTYTADPGNTGLEDFWFSCNSPPGPPTSIVSAPAGCSSIASTGSTSYVAQAGDAGRYIAVFETDVVADYLAGQPTVVVSNALQVSAASPPPPPPPSPPTNHTPPSISGSTISGSTLSAHPGQWTGSGNSYSYSWSRCSKSSGGFTNCSVQSTSASYHLSASDVGRYIRLSQTATNAGGSATATSAAVGPITAPPGPTPTPAPTAAPSAGAAVPTISGAPQVGAAVTASPVTMSHSPSYAYQWLRCAGQSCTAIPGASAVTYSPAAADLGTALMFTETGTNASGSGQAQSAKTAIVTAATETTLQITPAGVVAGQTATLVATVTSATAQAPPAGAITFEQAGTAIAGCVSIVTHPTGASATITCQTTFAGSASTLSAVFTPSPGAQVTGSDSSAVGFVLGRAATTASMNLPAHVAVGKRLTVTAKVVPEAGTTGVSPTGTVVFLDGEKAIKGCTPTLAAGVAHCTVSYNRLGRHAISADYLGDGNFSGSSTRAHALAVVVAEPSGFVSSLMTWTFDYRPQYTRVSTLMVTGVQPGLEISVGCTGRGCPRQRYVESIKRAACSKHGGSGNHATHGRCTDVNLAKHFAGRKLGVGATLTVRLTHRGWLGKYYSFVVRHGRKPKIDTACLAVGQTRPGAGCTHG